MNYYPDSSIHIKNKIKFELILSNYPIKFDKKEMNQIVIMLLKRLHLMA